MMLRQFAILYLLVQALAGLVWWIVLLTWQESRLAFKDTRAPDSTLLAFGLADGILFVGTSALCGYGFAWGRRWAWPVLCIHTGAAGYAALYCWMLFALTGDAWLGAVLMSPSLVIPGYLVWKLRVVQG